MKTKPLAVASAFAVLAPVFADVYYLRQSDADWSKPESFAMSDALTDEASSVPGSSDDVYLPANADVSLTSGTESFSRAASVGRIVPQGGSRLILSVNGEATFGALINAGGVLDTTPPVGTVVKCGDGVLTLTATSSLPGNANLDFSYYVSFDIDAGALVFPQSGNALHRYYGDVTVAAGATQHLAACTSKEAYTRMRSLCGAGTVTGGSYSSTRTQYLYITEVADATVRASVFDGRIEGKYTKVLASGNLTLTNAGSSFESLLTVQQNRNALSGGTNGMVSTTSFGLISQPSPLGKHQQLTVSTYGGGFRYVGTTGERTDKVFAFQESVTTKIADPFIDGGPHGGVTFTGQWQNKSESVKNLHLIGSNTVPCIASNSWLVSANNGYPFFLTKGGTGTWTVVGNTSVNRDLRGGLAVEDGVLRFTSISNIGENCDLGFATFLTRPMTGVPTASDMRIYAHTIGNTDADANAVFEYAGKQCAIATNRPTVLVGKGTIRSMATGKGYLALTDVSPRDAAAVTLVLDGTNANHNLMRDISDGTGVVSVVKRGSGEWTLSGDTRFSGSLRVEEGTLTVLGPRYTWFRLSVMQAGDGAAENTGSTRGQIVTKRIALYDTEGVRQNVGLSYDMAFVSSIQLADANWQELTPGSVKMGRPGYRKYDGWYHDLAMLFDDDGTLLGTENGTVTFFYSTTAEDTQEGRVISSTNDPSTWVSYVMRLTNGVPEIASYDIQSYHNNSIAKRWPRYVRMEGSRDGVKWDWLGDHDFDPSKISGQDKWLSNGDSFTPGAVRKGKGVALLRGADPDAFVLSNVTHVAVSSGALLRTFDDVTLSSIEVDCSDCGTIQGFTLAPEGELNIKNLPTGSSNVLPQFLSGATGISNLENWCVALDGKPSAKVRLHVSGSVVSVMRPGFIIIMQ